MGGVGGRGGLGGGDLGGLGGGGGGAGVRIVTDESCPLNPVLGLTREQLLGC